MLVVLDAGNTDIVGAIFQGNDMVASFRLRSIARKTEDEYAGSILSLLADKGIDLSKIRRAMISSVVPSLTQTLVDLCRKRFGIEADVLGPAFYRQLPLRLPSPREIGSDLVANALAARALFGTSAIVADFGTALTFTALRKAREAGETDELLGVAIAPGIHTAIASLSRATAQLPEVEPAAPASVIGTDTVMAIQSGVVHGYAGLVCHMVAKMKGEIGGEVGVVATGGLCRVIAPLVDCFDRVEPELTLHGLRLAADYAGQGLNP